jgi:hypothetical protein
MSVFHRSRTIDEAEPTAVSGPAVDGGDAAGCAVCPHPWDVHDQIATRFCTATITGQFSRGCVCTAYSAKDKTVDK